MPLTEESSVLVAVRCRPFNQRELAMGIRVKCIMHLLFSLFLGVGRFPRCCVCPANGTMQTPCIEMTPEATKIANPETSEEKSYRFNHHLWSHSKWNDPENKQGARDDFVDQDRLFELIGTPSFFFFFCFFFIIQKERFHNNR
jgi:hypothetical protein